MFPEPSSLLEDLRFRACFANAATGIAIVDFQGSLVEVNPAFCRILGYSADEISGLRFITDTGEKSNFRRLVAGEISGYVIERHHFHKDGSRVWTRNSVSLLFDKSGVATHVMTIMEDLTEKKLLEDRARQSHKMEALGRLAGGIAHDFNNLLMIINSYASLLKDDFGSETPMGGKARAIEEAGIRAAGLTRQLLAFSRKQVLQPQVVSIDDLLHSSEEILRRLIREDIEFVTELAAKACIEADLGQLQQVLMNLVVNASDAMPNGGRLTIQTSSVHLLEEVENGNGKIKPGFYVLLTVADTGVGMDAATRERIFEPFFTTKGKGKGTGLGLATVYGIIQQSGGHVFVASALGEGTTFSIYLPALQGGGKARAAELSTAAVRKQIRATVLLVEDEESLRRCLLNTLSSMGCFVLHARDGAHALEVAKRQLLLVDLVITDIVMPSMSGPALVKALRLLRPNLPVIYMSGYADTGLTPQELRAGYTAYFQKPFSIDHLRRAVEEMLSHIPISPSTR